MSHATYPYRIAAALRSALRRVRAIWAAGPAPCWTEYLRESSGR